MMHGANDKAADLTESLLTNADTVEEQELVVVEEEAATERPPSQYRDVPFAVAFYVHLLVILGIAIKSGFPSLHYTPPATDYTPPATVEFSGLLYIVLIAGLVAILISACALSIMTRFSQFLVQFSVLFSMFSSLIMVIILGFHSQDGAALIAFAMFVMSAFYAWTIWHRIPFAAMNLTTALTAVRANLGVAIIAYGLVIVSVGWTLLWMIALIGVYTRTADCNKNGTCTGSLGGSDELFFLLSFYWTQQVIKNMIHVSVSGVVGTWWFDPVEASSLCSKAIMDSFLRSATFSFGSICFGSLIVAIIQVIRHLVEHARRQSNHVSGILLCILDCIIACVERLVNYFNKWAYTYIGLYGYGYMEAGQKVMALFAQRGWTTIINDDLVLNVLNLMSLVIGAITGVIGLGLAKAHKSWVSELPDEDSLLVPFVSCFLLGFLISSILMSVVASAVDTVIVCFAEASNEFQTNYPALSEEMVKAWRSTYPQEFLCPSGIAVLQGDDEPDALLYAGPVAQAHERPKTDPLAPPSD